MARLGKFTCSVCRGRWFALCRYMTRTASCPALECANCHAITLDENVAASAKECESVREMVAARARIYCDGEIERLHSAIS
jgi:hypothetical protein